MRFTLILASVLSITACKKSEPGTPPLPAGTRLELSLDSLYLFAKETYLFYQSLPDYSRFAPRQYATTSSDIAALQNALQGITNTAINPTTGSPYEYRAGHSQPLYSFIAKGNIITGRAASVGFDGKGNDLGFELAIVNDTAVYVRLVQPGSPAAIAGIRRGMRIVQLDGRPVPTNPVTLQGVLDAETLPVQIQQQGGNLITATLHRTSYTASPVLSSAIIDAGNKKAAYLALARFSLLANALEPLQQAFTSFAHQGIAHLVIDLRYNAGGYVETAQLLANLAAPASLNGQVMYTEHYNDLLQQGKAPLLKQIPYLDANRQPVYVNGRPATYADIDYSVKGNTYRFEKKGLLTGIKSVVFIVSGSTASASEQLINCLKPYVEVKLVGTTTYGKPVGFFGIGIDVYTAYLAQFRILNAQGAGDYYQGLPADIPAIDDVTRDFGDPAEACLQRALEYIGKSASRSRQVSSHVRTVIPLQTNPCFTGMIETRLPLQ